MLCSDSVSFQIPFVVSVRRVLVTAFCCSKRNPVLPRLNLLFKEFAFKLAFTFSFDLLSPAAMLECSTMFETLTKNMFRRSVEMNTPH